MTESGPTEPDDSALLLQEIERRSARGWEVVYEGEAFIQIRKRKELFIPGILWLVLLPLLLGIVALLVRFAAAWVCYVAALVGLIGVAIDYLLRRDHLEIVSLAEVKGREPGPPEPEADAAFIKRLAVQIGMTVGMIAIAILVLIVVVGSHVTALR